MSTLINPIELSQQKTIEGLRYESFLLICLINSVYNIIDDN